MVYSSLKLSKSVNRLWGLQDEYSTLLGLSLKIALLTLLERPERGGFITTLSTLSKGLASILRNLLTSDAKKEIFSILFILALHSANLTISEPTSTPQTCLAKGAKHKPIEPAPQKRSKTIWSFSK